MDPNSLEGVKRSQRGERTAGSQAASVGVDNEAGHTQRDEGVGDGRHAADKVSTKLVEEADAVAAGLRRRR